MYFQRVDVAANFSGFLIYIIITRFSYLFLTIRYLNSLYYMSEQITVIDYEYNKKIGQDPYSSFLRGIYKGQ